MPGGSRLEKPVNAGLQRECWFTKWKPLTALEKAINSNYQLQPQSACLNKNLLSCVLLQFSSTDFLYCFLLLSSSSLYCFPILFSWVCFTTRAFFYFTCLLKHGFWDEKIIYLQKYRSMQQVV